MGTLLLRFAIGMASALLVWMLFEPQFPKQIDSDWERIERLFLLTLGLAVGASVGAINGYFQGSRTHVARGAILGAAFGAVGVGMGMAIGSKLAATIFGPGWSMAPSLATAIPARILALTPVGLFLGAGIGASSLSVRRCVQGAIGGALGAGSGAAVFDLVGQSLTPVILAAQGQTVGEVGIVSRGLTAMAIGGMIALFIGIVDRLSRSAWLRLTLGRNEGREWALDFPQNFIGRSESAQIPLFGDPGVAPQHACIVRQGGQYLLVDGGAPGGTFLNGQPIQQAPLHHGAHIRIGGFSLEFLMKAGRAPARGPEAYASQPHPIGGPAHGSLYGPNPSAQPSATPASMPTMAYPASPAMTSAAVAAPSGGPALVALDGPLAGQRFSIAGPIEIGRECPAIPIGYDSSASRRHAGIAPVPGGLAITDLGSTNGIYVDGQRVASATLAPGQAVKIGATTFRVEA